ncbi:MAG: hypothetical protein IJS45_04790 [Clostridia bacterium]|nr:hypothetical protein [Clostridia bacterium]
MDYRLSNNGNAYLFTEETCGCNGFTLYYNQNKDPHITNVRTVCGKRDIGFLFKKTVSIYALELTYFVNEDFTKRVRVYYKKEEEKSVKAIVSMIKKAIGESETENKRSEDRIEELKLDLN